MEIQIRHQIDDLNEEIYFVKIYEKDISYNGIYFSKRKSKEDIWGYDYCKYYNSQEQFEINKLKELAGLDENSQDDWLLESSYSEQYKEILNKYNPVCLGLLSGVYGGNRWKDHPPKMSLEDFKLAIKKEVNKIIDRNLTKFDSQVK